MIREKEKNGFVSLRDFYVRRAYRILPVAYLYLAVMMLFCGKTLPTRDLIFSWTYLTCYLPGVTWNLSHLWSLSVEEQFYLLWPLAFVLGRSKKLAWGAVISAPFFRLILSRIANRYIGGFAFPAVFDSIAVGCLLALYEVPLSKFETLFRSRLVGAISWCFVLLLALVQPHVGGLAWHAMGPLYNFAAGFSIRNAITTRPWLLNNPVTVWVGALSYSLYIWQMPFANPNYGISWPIGIAASFLAATVSFYCVERPILNLRTKLRPVVIGTE
jgi:peptidoglycan/LPS O-acetylase OafA/YrhL